MDDPRRYGHRGYGEDAKQNRDGFASVHCVPSLVLGPEPVPAVVTALAVDTVDGRAWLILNRQYASLGWRCNVGQQNLRYSWLFGWPAGVVALMVAKAHGSRSKSKAAGRESTADGHQIPVKELRAYVMAPTKRDVGSHYLIWGEASSGFRSARSA